MLELDDGERFTEGPAIVQYLADRAPQKKLAPAHGSMERYRLQEWLNFITSELHKGFGPLFTPTTPEDYKPTVREKLLLRFGFVDGALAKKSYLLGNDFSVADAYLFTVANWSGSVGVGIKHLAKLGEFMHRVRERPSVQAALEAEGLPK